MSLVYSYSLLWNEAMGMKRRSPSSVWSTGLHRGFPAMTNQYQFLTGRSPIGSQTEVCLPSTQPISGGVLRQSTNSSLAFKFSYSHQLDPVPEVVAHGSSPGPCSAAARNPTRSCSSWVAEQISISCFRSWIPFCSICKISRRQKPLNSWIASVAISLSLWRGIIRAIRISPFKRFSCLFTYTLMGNLSHFAFRSIPHVCEVWRRWITVRYG